MQAERPARCCECNLCVKRPKDELPPGEKKTYYCLLLQKDLSGRGIQQPDIRHRFSCRVNLYREYYCKWNGRFPVARDVIKKYNIDQMKMPI